MSALAVDAEIANSAPPSQADRDVLAPWQRRKEASRAGRRPYELTWQISQFFAAGIQWLAFDQRTQRVLEDPGARDRRGRPFDVVDVLRQYNGTVLGKLAQGDMRPELLAAYDNDETADLYAKQLNDAVDFAWQEETKADRHLLAVLRTLIELGTAGVRCRYDRSVGKLVAPQVPHVNGVPLLGEGEAAAHVHQQYVAGLPVDLRPVREGKIVLEKLSSWNLLPPPGIEDPADFPYELIVRPVYIPELKLMYGAKANGVTADKIEEMGMLSYQASRYNQNAAGATSPATVAGLREHALVYTGYLRPNAEFPSGETVVFTHDGHLLDRSESLPYTDEPWGPRSGITYFRWTILEGRFWGSGFMEPGIGPQKIRNKRSSQIDLAIDSGQTKVFIEEGSIDTSKIRGVPFEVIKVKPGSTLPKPDGGIPPGSWMQADIELQDTNIQKALGLYGAGVGDNPSAVTTYGQLALLTENEVTKFGPIATEFKLGVCDVQRDMIESMRAWPANKQILIAGDESRLQVAAFDAKRMVPSAYLVRPAAGSGLPRSQGAELQKITDIWNAAVASQAALQNPGPWLEWFVESLNAGKAQEIPGSDSGAIEQQRKAALENVVMVHTGQVLPVSPEDDAQVHVVEHDQEIGNLAQAAALGDVQAPHLMRVIEQHKQLHLLMAQQNATVNPPAAPPPPLSGPAGPPAPQAAPSLAPPGPQQQ